MTGGGPEDGPQDEPVGDERQSQDGPALPAPRTRTALRVVFIALVALALAVGIVSLFVGGEPTNT